MPDLPRDDKNWWQRRTNLEKKLIILAGILGILALIFILVTLLSESCPEDVDEEECTTKHCVQAAAELLEFIDLKQDPCEDFYRFSCGAYYKNALKKDSPSPWTSTETLFKNEIKAIVVDEIKAKDSSAQILLKQFYHECMNETKIDEDDNEAFIDALDELGGWPLINGSSWDAAGFDWVEWYIKAKQIGLPVIGLFNFESAETPLNRTVLRVSGPKLDYDSYHTFVRYKRLMKKITESFDVDNQEEENVQVYRFFEKIYKYREEMEDKFDFATDEYEIEDDDDDQDKDESNDDDDDDDDDDNESKLKTVLPTIGNLTEICPEVPWLKILNGINGNSSDFDMSSEVIYDMDNLEKYCDALEKLLKKTHPKVIANYYIWTIIENSRMFLDKDVRRAYEDEADDEDDRFKVCYKATDERFKFVKETVYVRKKTNKEVKEKIQEMIDLMKDLFIERLKVCEWMDDKTRVAAVEKAQLIESVIGADDELYDIENFDKYLGIDEFEFDSDNIFEMYRQKIRKEDQHLFETLYKTPPENWESFFTNAVEVNAFFLPTNNIMVIPAPILTSIFFNKKFPAYMNYGPMESTIGHEFMHGFSEDAREVMLENDTIIDWWTNETTKMYKEKVECVVQEYQQIPFRYRLNGSLTLNENVADYVGADLGYEAYLRYVKKHGEELKLPGIPLTPEQIYWVQTATNFCFRKLDDNQVDYEEEDVHGIPAFRIEAPAKNSKHFAEAFNCPVGSRMNPETRCQVL